MDLLKTLTKAIKDIDLDYSKTPSTADNALASLDEVTLTNILCDSLASDDFNVATTINVLEHFKGKRIIYSIVSNRMFTLYDDKAQKLKSIQESKEFIDSILIANEAYNLNLPGIVNCSDKENNYIVNPIKVYNAERCICDIIRSKKRMDNEYIKYSIREYIKRKDKDLVKLSKYADKMGIKKEVMDLLEWFYE